MLTRYIKTGLPADTGGNAANSRVAHPTEGAPESHQKPG